MSRKFILECRIDLPANGFEQAEIIAKVKAPWDALVESVTAIGGQHIVEIMEARTTPAPYTGKKRGRPYKRNLVAVANPEEAAD